jgi:hypothetical protein
LELLGKDFAAWKCVPVESKTFVVSIAAAHQKKQQKQGWLDYLALPPFAERAQRQMVVF